MNIMSMKAKTHFRIVWKLLFFRGIDRLFSIGRRNFEGKGNEIKEKKIISVTKIENVSTYWKAIVFNVCSIHSVGKEAPTIVVFQYKDVSID